MKLRYIILWATALLVLGWVNFSILQNERLIRAGETIFLEIGPRDPRSLIQGDYMAMLYQVGQEIENLEELPPTGYLVIRLDEQKIGHFVRLDDEQTPLAADERRLRYRKRVWDVQIGAESFFFQEGQAELYSDARYAELRLTPPGETLLVGLRGPDLEVLGPTE
jgi:uncharacterized membrane-anchored protein